MTEQKDNNAFHEDPALVALLDEALGPASLPEGVPAGLEQRVFDATWARVAARRGGVLARLGGDWLGRVRALKAVAAMVNIAATAGIVLTAATIVRDAKALVIAEDNIRRDIVSIAYYSAPAATIDREMQMLAIQIELTQDDPGWDADQQRMNQALRELELPQQETLWDTTF